MSTESLRVAFGQSLVRLAYKYPNFVVFDADVAGGTCTHFFRNDFPDRFIQCGIAEQNMMSAAAGYSLSGITPFVTCYAVFASMRAVEQARNSVAYPDFNVKIVASHVGLDVGPDGVSHQALEDLAIFRAIPNFTVISPADEREVLQATEVMLRTHGPTYMRTGRSPVPDVTPADYQFKIGKGVVLKDGSEVTIVATGIMVHRAIAAAQHLKNDGINAKVVNISTIKPIDRPLLQQCASHSRFMVTCEDHNIYGGLFSSVLEAIADAPVPVYPVAVRDCFAESGEPLALAQKYGISEADIINLIKSKHN
ncbi:MAG: transketolase family protein [Deltaproteobacteria bacterium]|nr:transketolase family protein [Deltaproteobacteria bacterium]